jgi:hypothetical protein
MGVGILPTIAKGSGGVCCLVGRGTFPQPGFLVTLSNAVRD